MDNPGVIDHGDNTYELDNAFSELIHILKSQSAVDSEEFKQASTDITDLARKFSDYSADCYKELIDQNELLDSVSEKRDHIELNKDEVDSKSTDNESLLIEHQRATHNYEDILTICEIVDEFDNDLKPFVELSKTTSVKIPVKLDTAFDNEKPV